MTKKHIVEKTPKYTLLTHVLKGDTSDGVPNVLSNDDVFVEGLRQTPVSAKKLDAMIQELESFGDDTPENPPSWYRNYQRNRRLIDLTYTPNHLKENILQEYSKEPIGKGALVLPYLINKKCKMLIEVASEFN